MAFCEWFVLENYVDNWKEVCRRSDLHAHNNHLADIQSRLSGYLRERYISRTLLRTALERSMTEHNLDIQFEFHLPQTEHIRKMAFGEALCLLFFREKDRFWLPLDKLGVSSNPEAITPGIDVLAFYFPHDRDSNQTDCLYLFEVKTTSNRAYVRQSIMKPKTGMLTLFNEKLVHRGMIQDEINLVLKTIEERNEQSSVIPRVLAFIGIPLEQRKEREYYCPMFVLDADLEVDDHLSLLRDIKHPVQRKWLHVVRIRELNSIVAATFREAAAI